MAAFDAFPGTIPASLKADFKTLTTAMKNWRTEILAYFDHPITNAYTEALNGVAKTINRQGRGTPSRCCAPVSCTARGRWSRGGWRPSTLPTPPSCSS